MSTDDNVESKHAELGNLRSEINRIDSEIIALLAGRRKISADLARLKDASGSPIRDSRREEEILLERMKLAKQHQLDTHFVTRLFHEIIDDSIRLQQEYLQRLANREHQKAALTRIAFHGLEGSYSHLAGKRYFARQQDQAAFMGFSTFEDVVKALESGQAEYAILPVENSTSGGINEVYDLLVRSQISLVGEEKYEVAHCLIGEADLEIANIRKIYCSPMALAECSRLLAGLPAAQVECLPDSALSVKRLKESGDKAAAAIASEEAARIFGLSPIKHGISNHPENSTRYLIAARAPRKVDLRIPCKTSIVMATAQRPGALVEALMVFKDNGINLTKLESRPMPGNAWEEMFYVDFEGNHEDERVKKALSDLTRVTRFMKLLGSYPSFDLPATPVEATSRACGACDDVPATQPAEAPKKSKAKKAYQLASREHKAEDTIIEVKGVKLGGDSFAVIAGPCSVESFEQIMTCARHAKENGAKILRGGCFKPRTSPYSFQGLGYEGLDMLVEAGRAFGMPVITEVMSTEDVEPVAAKTDIIQIGARNMQNFNLLKAIGRTHRPVMLKRGLSSTLEDLLMATEYILAGGNQQVFLCERGIRTFETATRNTLDLSAVPVLKQLTHLPVFVDPSHAAGERDLVPPLALAAKAVGSHGIMVEFHPEPEKALSDGPQALRFPQFETLMHNLLR